MEELKNLEIESTDKEGKKNKILLSELADFTTREDSGGPISILCISLYYYVYYSFGLYRWVYGLIP